MANATMNLTWNGSSVQIDITTALPEGWYISNSSLGKELACNTGNPDASQWGFWGLNPPGQPNFTFNDDGSRLCLVQGSTVDYKWEGIMRDPDNFNNYLEFSVTTTISIPSSVSPISPNKKKKK